MALKMNARLFASVLVVLNLFIIVPRSCGALRPIKIGAIFHAGDEEYMNAFKKAVIETKSEHIAPSFKVETSIKQVEVNTDSFKTAAAACKLLEEGVAAIFGPSSPYTYGIVASIAARFDVPHIDYFWRQNEELQADQEPKNPKPMTINFFPDSEMVGQDSAKLSLWEVREESTINITGLNLRNEEGNEVEGINWVESAILYDSVFLVYNALETLNARNQDNTEGETIDPVPLSCEGEEKYNAGPNITNVIRELSKEGKITGPITIDENGQRQFFKLKIIDVRPDESVEIGYWDPEGLHTADNEKERESYLYKSIEQKKFKISTKLGPPYVMEVTDSATRGILIEQTRYEGFCIDLIEEIAKLLNFKYEFELVPDGNYGTLNKETKQWNGLIRRLLDHDADLAICDLTITYERESAVDFTMPFMNLGISILYRKPEEKEPDLFSFLSPLSTDVWIYMATAFLAVSIMLFLQARMAPGEWDNPHPCNPDPEELENNFDLKNSMWLTVGSLMQQGSDILPKAPSIRMVAGMWWFFTLIMVSSYTANLAAFLTVDKMDNPIKGVEDLAKQTKIKYGAVAGGSTSAFFRDSNYSTYQRMWAAMQEARPSVFTKSNDEGVDRVLKKRDYAFLMESTTIEYRMERNCDLDKVGGLIDNKGYGIALPRNSPYRTPISGAILMLQEKGVLQDLKKKWWEERGGGLCSKIEVEPTSSSELGLANVGGVFLVLLIGCCGSFIIAVFEFLWNVRKVAVKEKVTPWEALVAELKFAVNIWAETKPVKISKSSGTSSMEDGIGRAASTARSIVGSFLRLDILDKFDKDNSTNNRSNDRKIN
ncbi:glutamate receptor ionotropic, kainate 2-like isoform X2 [Apis cerana]|uniref:glutamate receptor ionotropic, kainate 2-like isoform X2 n=1 Tax=Apis cerana TaxID=7461 RepID=UPI0007E2DBDF|nr:glutamate receptor ionotropic, kainate 2-like isoform X2 [Apis cerana]